jgi:hypothetical protein
MICSAMRTQCILAAVLQTPSHIQATTHPGYAAADSSAITGDAAHFGQRRKLTGL